MSEYKTKLTLHLDLLINLSDLSHTESIADDSDWLENNDPHLLDNAMLNHQSVDAEDIAHSILTEPFTYQVTSLCLTNTEDAYFLDNNGEKVQLKNNDIIKVHTQYYKVTIDKAHIINVDDTLDYDSALDSSDIWGAQPLSIDAISNTHVTERLKRQLWEEHALSERQNGLSFLYGNNTDVYNKKKYLNNLSHEQHDSIYTNFSALSPSEQPNLVIEHQVNAITTKTPKYNQRDQRRALSTTTKQGNILQDLNIADMGTSILTKNYDSGKSTFQEQSPVDILDELLIYNEPLQQKTSFSAENNIALYTQSQITKNSSESKFSKILNRFIR